MSTEPTSPKAKKQPKAPQDHKPKAVAAAAEGADVENVTTFEFDGQSFTAYGDNITGEVMEQLEQGLIHAAVRALIGEEQWKVAKKYPLRKIKDLWTAWGEAAKQGNS